MANGPAWHDRFLKFDFDDVDPDSFPTKDRLARDFDDYARMIAAPIRTGVEVTRVERLEGRPGFRVSTSRGDIEAQRIVAATGPVQAPVFPEIMAAGAGVMRLHPSAYKNPGQLPEGAVLVVGRGASGSQIVEELQRAGRKVHLSVGEHSRPPRSCRGRDDVWWLGVLGKWDEITVQTKKRHVAFAVSGYDAGETIDCRRLAAGGVTLLGVTESYENGGLLFAGDLAANIAAGDEAYLDVLREADAHVARNGLDLRPEPEAWIVGPDPDCVTDPIRRLDLREAGIGAILWATGFRFDFSWLAVDAFHPDGRPYHKRGISAERGIYFLGLPELTNRASSFIYGCWYDAKYIATHIMVQRNYAAYPGRRARNLAAE